MKLIPSVLAMCMLVGSSVVLAEGSGAGAGGAGGAGGADVVAPAPQLMEQKMLGKPDIAGDGINNAFQVDDPSEIGRSDSAPTDAPEPLPVEGEAGALEAK